jgi:hypothetical protein
MNLVPECLLIIAAVSDGRAALGPKLSGKRSVLAARDAVDGQVPELLGDVVKRAEGIEESRRTLMDGRSCSMRG